MTSAPPLYRGSLPRAAPDAPVATGEDGFGLWWMAFVLATLFVTSSVFADWARSGDSFEWRRLPWYCGEYVSTLTLAACLAAADRFRLEGRARLIATAISPMVASLAWFAWSLGTIASVDVAWRLSPLRLTLANFIVGCVLLTALAFAYEFHRRARQRAAALQVLQREQAELARFALETRLKAMQAQVDPRFLFGTLKDVDRIQVRRPHDAGALLEELIVYLRTALPGLRDTASTVGREAALLRAYLAVLALRSAGRLSFEIAIDDDAKDLPVPPMILLPLVESLLPPVDAVDLSVAASKLAIQAHRLDGRAALSIESNRPLLDERAIAPIRERLREVYGDAADVVARRLGAVTTTISLELPPRPSVREPRGEILKRAYVPGLART